MKKTSKFILTVMIMIIGLIFIMGLYNLIFLGQKDFGLVYEYYYCENGIYYIYLKGVIDGSTTYYNKNGQKLATCTSWKGRTEECDEVYNLTQNCKENGFDIFWPFN